MPQAPFPADLWVRAAKQLLDAARTTVRWLDQYQPPGEAASGDLQVFIYPEPPPKDDPESE